MLALATATSSLVTATASLVTAAASLALVLSLNYMRIAQTRNIFTVM